MACTFYRHAQFSNFDRPIRHWIPTVRYVFLEWQRRMPAYQAGQCQHDYHGLALFGSWERGPYRRLVLSEARLDALLWNPPRGFANYVVAEPYQRAGTRLVLLPMGGLDMDDVYGDVVPPRLVIPQWGHGIRTSWEYP